MIKLTKSFFHAHKKRIAVSLISLIVLLAVTSGPLLVYAVIRKSELRNAAIQAKNAQIEAAILNDDYNTWYSLETDENIKSKINQSNFHLYAEAYHLLQQGKVDEANLIKKQLSLKQDFEAVATKSIALDNAIEKGDYNTWRRIVGNATPQVNSSNFAQYAAAYKLIEAGRIKKAGSILIDIGTKINLYDSGR
ncbi:MAG: hypothetical protein WCN88_04565 [Candidatus Falkowbacteria bacterium]